MRISDLLGRQVVDGRGTVLGHVHDVLLVEEHPTDDSPGTQLRVHGLAVGRRALGTRLGVVDGHVETPAWLRALGRERRVVPWDSVVEVGAERITVDPHSSSGSGRRDTDASP